MAGYLFLNRLHGWPAVPLAPVGTPVYALATTMTLACIVAAQVGAVFASRTDRASVLSVGLLTNRLVLLGVAVEAGAPGPAAVRPPAARGLRHGAPRPAGAGLPADLAAGHPAGRRGAQGAAPPAGRPRLRAPPGRRRRRARGRRRRRVMRIVVVGCGRWGAGLAQTLQQAGHAVAVVDPDPGAFARLGGAFRGRTVAGDGLDREVLREAGVEQADALAAVTASDEVNVVVARAARSSLAGPPGGGPGLRPRPGGDLPPAGPGHPVRRGPGGATPGRVAAVLHLEPVLALDGGGVEVVAAEVPPLLAGRPVGELGPPGRCRWWPSTAPAAPSYPGRGRPSRPATACTWPCWPGRWSASRRSWGRADRPAARGRARAAPGSRRSRGMNVLVIGGGQVGGHLASLLLADGHTVTVVELRPDVAGRVRREAPGVAALVASGVDPAALEAAGVRRADIVAAVAGTDETNLAATSWRASSSASRAPSPASTTPGTPGCSGPRWGWTWR